MKSNLESITMEFTYDELMWLETMAGEFNSYYGCKDSFEIENRLNDEIKKLIKR